MTQNHVRAKYLLLITPESFTQITHVNFTIKTIGFINLLNRFTSNINCNTSGTEKTLSVLTKNLMYVLDKKCFKELTTLK